MNLKDSKYQSFALVREMLETGSVVSNVSAKTITAYGDALKYDSVFFTGEGSSRIFPAKKTMYDAQKHGYKEHFSTDCATQALEYKLDSSAVFVASNSGKTKEGVRLIRSLKKKGHSNIIGVVANGGTPIIDEADGGYLLTCGKEEAVAATKSVIEQTLFYDLIFRRRNNLPMPDLTKLGDLITQALEMPVPEEIVRACEKAPVIYFAGRNTGVAEELTLKTNEITRKKSDFLEGTYAVHGIEEVMNQNEAVIVVDPFADEEDKFSDVLIKGVGLSVSAIATRKTSFPTMVIPEYGDFTNYIELAAGWNLLVEVGIAAGIDLDKPERARKVGNEFQG